MNDFVSDKKPKMIACLTEYLAGKKTHAEINAFAWEIVGHSSQTAPLDEEVFWSTAFSIIHLADADHWEAGVTQKDLAQMLDLLKNDKPLPTEWKNK